MVQANEVLLDQLLANANDPSWYVSFQDSVEKLSEEDAFWSPNENSHCIAEITQHLIYWNETWQVRYQNAHVKAVPRIEDNSSSFLIPEAKTFIELKEQLLNVLLQWQSLLREEKINKEVKGIPVHAEWWEIIGNVTTHNAYHIGQIVYIRKLQKSWEA
ncbi:DinB family protein [Thalassobacillus sp. CUG 92003]|uniref:DinB family protein n=1 Tax=Thalassobacillus sp. CUG 92003 TaxID=2736641 RepID=UPI0015E73106|nr:DinB family protein [Thalassobacillus sp. CUG 92003]